MLYFHNSDPMKSPFILFVLLLIFHYTLPVTGTTWKPIPPCSIPSGISSPAVQESMCMNEIATLGDIIIREIGLPVNETLVEVEVSTGDWITVLHNGITSILNYFTGTNSEGMNILGARTVPITVRSKDNETWIVGMMISTALYPSVANIPQPIAPVQLNTIGRRLIAVKQINTTFYPTLGPLDTTCDDITNSPLPNGFTLDLTSPWSPTLVMYNGELTTDCTSECWIEVKRNR